MAGLDLYAILRELHIEKQRLDGIIREVESLKGGAVPALIPAKRRGRKSMSSEERREVSQRMRRYWARRRKE